MNRRLILICSVIVLAMAVPAFAAVQNVKVSGDITAYGIARNNFDLGRKRGSTTGGEDEANVFMSQVRVRIDADLTDNVSTTVRLLNERDWDIDAANANTTEIDLDLAYVTLKEMLYSPLTVVIGRQPLRYGNAMIIGDPDTNRVSSTENVDDTVLNEDLSIRKAFDAVKAILNYDPLTIDLFYSKIDENTKLGGGYTAEKDDIDLFGLNANYKVGDNYDSVVEAYFFTKRDQSVANTATPPDNPDIAHTPGLRISTNPIEGLNLQVEQAWQFGSKNIPVSSTGVPTRNNRKREAMATQAMASYALPLDALEKYAPVIGATFSRFSGDKNAADTSTQDEYKAWDPMYEDQATGKISNVLFQQTNVRVANGNLSLKPIEDLGLRLDWSAIWLDRDLNISRWGNENANLMSLYQLNNTSYTPRMAEGENFLGQEIDATLTYDYTEDVQFGLLGGVYFAGDAFDKGDALISDYPSDDNRIATQLIASCKVTF